MSVTRVGKPSTNCCPRWPNPCNGRGASRPVLPGLLRCRRWANESALYAARAASWFWWSVGARGSIGLLGPLRGNSLRDYFFAEFTLLFPFAACPSQPHAVHSVRVPSKIAMTEENLHQMKRQWAIIPPQRLFEDIGYGGLSLLSEDYSAHHTGPLHLLNTSHPASILAPHFRESQKLPSLLTLRCVPDYKAMIALW